jgi:hypothetical protein
MTGAGQPSFVSCAARWIWSYPSRQPLNYISFSLGERDCTLVIICIFYFPFLSLDM